MAPERGKNTQKVCQLQEKPGWKWEWMGLQTLPRRGDNFYFSKMKLSSGHF